MTPAPTAPSTSPGQIVILNGAPRSGKSSIALAVQQGFEGVWMNLGVDTCARAMPPSISPGVGLRPGGERPDLEPLLPNLYAALYETIAAHSRFGIDVVADLGHHDRYSRPLGILPDCARRLAGLPVLFVGVRCPIETIMARRNAGAADAGYVRGTEAEPVPAPVALWHEAVHDPGIYDLWVDTAELTPEACAEAIREALAAGPRRPTAFERLAGM